MKLVTFTPKEVIFVAGDLGQEMYIIRKGNVAVVGKDHQMMSLLTAGMTFGQFALLTPGVGAGAGISGGGSGGAAAAAAAAPFS
jgi:signal-transduction protein with cAMP-binding, CBS, and nucleotidyltransferase domain